jgi:pimeloyl-ACP methyl ester carboxylesterase
MALLPTQASGAHVEDLSTIITIAPLGIPSASRGADLHVRVSAPIEGERLPILIFSHGNGQSLHAYGPLTNYWASKGFVVIQPTHLDSRLIGLAKDDPRRAHLWRTRERDLVAVLDALDHLEGMVPFLRGRLDRERIAVAGHSWGAQTASMLLGATHPDPDDGTVVNIKDQRIGAGVLLTVPGTGGANLSAFAAENFPFMHPDFSGMTTPTLIIAGDNDHGAMTVRGPDWWREAYDLSPSPKALFTVFGGEHSLGGIANYEARETTDERPQRVAAIQRLSTAFLRRALYAEEAAWAAVVDDCTRSTEPEGRVETK